MRGRRTRGEHESSRYDTNVLRVTLGLPECGGSATSSWWRQPHLCTRSSPFNKSGEVLSIHKKLKSNPASSGSEATGYNICDKQHLQLQIKE